MNFIKSKTKAIVPEKYLASLREIRQKYFHYREKLNYVWRGWQYRGNQFICPCCNGQFREFLTVGIIPRPNAQCPRCFSLERHRLLWLYLKEKTNFFSKRIKFLHFAPEFCLQRNILNMANIEYISTDLESDLAMVKNDITNMEFKDNSFDVILCSHVLEHIPDDSKAMRELVRVLKPDGWAILQVPIDIKMDKTLEDENIVSPSDRERFFGQKDHVRMYGIDYKDRLEEAGFTVKIDGYVRELGSDAIEKYSLIPEEDIYFCTISHKMVSKSLPIC